MQAESNLHPVMVKEDLKGKAFVDSTTDVSYASTSKSHVVPKDSKRCEIFHIRVISKNTKIDTLIDSGSQVNLILEVVK